MLEKQEHWLESEEAMTSNAENEYQITPSIFCQWCWVPLNQQL